MIDLPGYDRLLQILKTYNKIAIAFSGGVDSSLLLKASCDAIGKENVIALKGLGDFFPKHEEKRADALALEIGVNIKKVPLNMNLIEAFSDNSPDRCYHCKKHLMDKLLSFAGDHTLLEGSNMDDLSDYRPGRRAIEEKKIGSPFLEAKLYKKDIREISKALGLPTWDTPSCACLASRIPYGQKIDSKTLAMIDRAEDYLRSLDFSQVRVRAFAEEIGLKANIEVLPQELISFSDDTAKGLILRNKVESELKNIGFTSIHIDPEGYRSGKLNPKS